VRRRALRPRPGALLARAPEARSGLDLAQELIEVYGAKQHFSTALQGQLQAFKSNPSLPAAQVEELKALIGHFKSPGCRKAFHDPGLDPKTLSPEDQQDIDRFLKSPVGVKFGEAWPRLKKELADIGRQWVTEALARASQAPAANSGHH